MKKIEYRIKKIRMSTVRDPNANAYLPMPKVGSSTDAAHIYAKVLRESAYTDGTIELFESFHILILNRANKICGCVEISRGGVAGTVVDAKIVFAAALATVGAASIILCHNHPSGNLNPSQADINLTRKLVSAGQLLDMLVLDHIILSEEGHYSFADNGLI